MIRIIVNNLAGSGKGKEAFTKVAQILNDKNIPYEVFTTTYRKHAIKLSKKLCEMPDTETVIAMGGDGTLNEVLQGFSNFDRVKLGIIPCGTGNDFATTAQIPTDIEKALDVILCGEAKYTDYLQMGDVRGLNAIGTGIDVDVLVRYLAHKVRTKATYTKSLISALLHFKPYEFNASFNGQDKDHSAFIVLAANGRFIGGGLELAPNAILDDGKMDIIIVEKMKKPAIPFALLKILKGKIFDIKQCAFDRSDEITITLKDAKGPVQIDGEIYKGIPLNIKLINNQLKVYRP